MHNISLCPWCGVTVKGLYLGEGIEFLVCSTDIIACMTPRLSNHYTTDCSTSQATSQLHLYALSQEVYFPGSQSITAAAYIIKHLLTSIDISEFKALSSSGASASKMQSRGFFEWEGYCHIHKNRSFLTTGFFFQYFLQSVVLIH